MLEPFLELMLDATDTAMTVIVLLALWEGRTARGRVTLGRWLRKVERMSDLDGFLREARAVKKSREIRRA